MTSPMIPISTAQTFTPFLEFLYEHGSPVNRWLDQCQLPHFLFDRPNSYIPTLNIYRFVDLAERREGIDEFGLHVSKDRILQAMGPRLVHSIYSAPTLLCAIREYGIKSRAEYSAMRVWTSEHDDNTVRINLKKSFPPHVPGFRQTEWLGVMAFIKLIEGFAGRGWQPDTISLISKQLLPPLAMGLFPDVHFTTNQQECYISFPKTLLSLRPSRYGTEVVSNLSAKSADVSPKTPPMGFAETVTEILKTYLRDGYLPIERASEIADTSKRSFQRRLAEDGLSYSKLVARARFEVAADLLATTDASSLEIAFETGYDDASHFARAFRRIAGCSPREYRRRTRRGLAGNG